ncbi:SHOCT domain-containing protein [Nocardiopsis sp. ATB16-24]|uniref:SHOCT domain-containing protein n=1 Tax=Nocardiopsis sp. ATB16-24 TaxID=3019555 RepID=UPI0025540022|nr:SHOCT domain-containing protein [Nocardiopsis sp. ATB16-24]
MGYVLAVFMVVFAMALCALCAVTVASTVRGAGMGSRSVGAVRGAREVDAAEEELRLRYARGEIDREEFLQRKIDLER